MADKIETADLLAAETAKNARKTELKNKRDGEREARAGESKADAFKRIVVRRANSALDAIATLRGLSNTQNYDYSPDQVAKVISALRGGVDKLEKEFAAGGVARAENGFDL